VAVHLQVGEVDGSLSDRTHVDEPCGSLVLERRDRPPGEQRRSEVVDGQPQFVTVRAELPPARGRSARADPGVVEQQCAGVMVGGYPVCQLTDVVE
jgi:hypothetical protein